MVYYSIYLANVHPEPLAEKIFIESVEKCVFIENK